MARKYSIQLTQEISDFATAIADYYGEGNYTIYYQDSQYLVFSIPAISNKVLRLKIVYNGSGGHLNYGDEWTSGSTITNAMPIHVWFETMKSNSYLILSQYSMQYFHQDDSQLATMIVGQLSNGEYAGIGLQHSTSNVGRAQPKLMTDNTDIAPMLPNISTSAITDTTSKIITFPMYILNAVSGNLLVDSEGNPVYMKDIRVCRYSSILDNDNLFNYSMNCFYDKYLTYGYDTVGFITEIDNYTL